jgi:Family of unknown function (DUF5996)
MSNNEFPLLQGEAWVDSRDALHAYARLIGKYRAAAAPKQKHWWQVGLLPSLGGFDTGLLHIENWVMSIELNLLTLSVVLSFRNKSELKFPLTGQSNRSLYESIQAQMASFAIKNVDQGVLSDASYKGLNKQEVAKFAQATNAINAAFEIFKGEQRRETGPIILWPHHFDLAMLWFSGRLVDGIDPADEENADEQVNFGFSVGDEANPEPYFYITAYPLPDGLETVQLPEGAYWHSQGWNGALMPYSVLTKVKDPQTHLLGFWRFFLAKAQGLM